MTTSGRHCVIDTQHVVTVGQVVRRQVETEHLVMPLPSAATP
jgi:hypothetical protein